MHGMDNATAALPIEFQMSLMLLTALGGYFLASWLRQPAVVGQILIGMLIGPSLLGWVSYTEFVKSLAALGAVVLLFTIGLEFQVKEIARLRYVMIATAGVLLPWTAGAGLAWLYGFEPQRAMFIGVSLAATSVAITADVLRELGKLKTEAARAIIGAAVIDDVLVLLGLSVTVQLNGANFDWQAIAWLLLKAVLFLGGGIAIGLAVVNRVIRMLHDSRLAQGFPEIVFVFAMATAFSYAVAAEVMGLSAIVGAFLAGVCLEGVALSIRERFRHGAEHLRIVFGAIFFVSLGVLADLGSLTWDLVGFLALLTTVAVASKLLGCGLSARWTGSGWRDAWVIGIGMSPRGEVAMVVALLALNAGIIAQPAYLALMLTAVLTSFFAPLALRFIYRGDAAQNPAR